MLIEIQKAMSAAWEYDHKEVVSRGRLDNAYELGFIAAWQARGYGISQQQKETKMENAHLSSMLSAMQSFRKSPQPLSIQQGE